MSKQSSSTSESLNSSTPKQGSPSAFPPSPFVYIHLCDSETRDLLLPVCQNSGFIACFRRRPCLNQVTGIFQGRGRPDDTGKFQAPSESPVFMFILTATVGRNLFCLDPCDTVSSSHRSKRSQELDKEWNIWTSSSRRLVFCLGRGDITDPLRNPRPLTMH